MLSNAARSLHRHPPKSPVLGQRDRLQSVAPIVASRYGIGHVTHLWPKVSRIPPRASCASQPSVLLFVAVRHQAFRSRMDSKHESSYVWVASGTGLAPMVPGMLSQGLPLGQISPLVTFSSAPAGALEDRRGSRSALPSLALSTPLSSRLLSLDSGQKQPHVPISSIFGSAAVFYWPANSSLTSQPSPWPACPCVP